MRFVATEVAAVKVGIDRSGPWVIVSKDSFCLICASQSSHSLVDVLLPPLCWFEKAGRGRGRLRRASAKD